MQQPTIGRKVWLWVPTGEVGKYGTVLDSKQAFDATVNFVDKDTGTIAITYFDHYGRQVFLPSVPLYDPKDTDQHTGGGEPYATWMPYQKQQYEKQAA